MPRLTCIAAAALVAFFACGCHRNTTLGPLPGTAHPAYTITDIGVGIPTGVNSKGQVVGEFAAGVFPNTKGFPYFHGFLWNNGKRTEMPTFGGWYSKASIVTDSGQVIGTASVRKHAAGNLPVNHICLWQNGQLTDLEADPRFRGITLLHLTKSGGVYAVSPPQGPKKQLHLWFYSSGFGPGIRQDKGIIGGSEVTPTAINDSGVVAGDWDTGKKYAVNNKMSVKQAFVWHIGQRKWTDLGTLGGAGSEATAISNTGQVAGLSDPSSDGTEPRLRPHAFFWDKGRMHDLGALRNGGFSYPNSINDEGQIVGFSEAGSAGDLHPVIWEQGQIKDLIRLIPAGMQWDSMSGAASINNYGQIVGSGSIEGSHWAHGYLLTPIGYKAVKGDPQWQKQ